MLGITLQELFSFGMQAGLALSGASALWGAVFMHKRKHDPHQESCLVFEWIANRLMWPLVAGFVVAFLSWILLASGLPASAHEGIVLERSMFADHAPHGFTTALFAILILLLAVFRGASSARPKIANAYLDTFYWLFFAVTLLLISFPVWLGEFSRAQWFFIGHSAHSIFTLGTVLILDFLFLISKSSALLKQHVYPIFPLISKVIWVGLGVDFLSVALVFPEAIQLTPKFFFMQTVVGILIINGVLLSGPITRKLIESVQKGGKQMTRRWTRIADVAGATSITSWSIITFVDFFEHLTLSFAALLGIYIGIIVLGIAGHTLWEKFQTTPEPIC